MICMIDGCGAPGEWRVVVVEAAGAIPMESHRCAVHAQQLPLGHRPVYITITGPLKGDNR